MFRCLRFRQCRFWKALIDVLQSSCLALLQVSAPLTTLRRASLVAVTSSLHLVWTGLFGDSALDSLLDRLELLQVEHLMVSHLSLWRLLLRRS